MSPWVSLVVRPLDVEIAGRHVSGSRQECGSRDVCRLPSAYVPVAALVAPGCLGGGALEGGHTSGGRSTAIAFLYFVSPLSLLHIDTLPGRRGSRKA